MSQKQPRKTTVLQEIGSVLASFFGVQSSKNRERDFTGGNAKRFIILGLLMTAAFVFTVMMVVQLVLALAGR